MIMKHYTKSSKRLSSSFTQCWVWAFKLSLHLAAARLILLYRVLGLHSVIALWSKAWKSKVWLKDNMSRNICAINCNNFMCRERASSAKAMTRHRNVIPRLFHSFEYDTCRIRYDQSTPVMLRKIISNKKQRYDK